MKTCWKSIRLLTALLMAMAVSRADEKAASVIRVSSNLVPVPVSVTDAAGNPVLDLGVEDFRIEEDGRRQQVVSLGAPGQTPIDLALLIDVSASVRERFQFEKATARDFLQSLIKSGDTVSIFSIGRVLRQVQAQTTDGGRAAASVMSVEQTTEATAFFDAVAETARYLGRTSGPGSRRVLLVLSDGEDTKSSRYKLDDALLELRRNDCLFYSINPSGPSIRLNKISLRGQDVMATLAADAGEAFVPESDDALKIVFGRIAGELQAQYLLGYYARGDQDSRFRKIAVTVPSKPGLHIRARSGYFAGK